MSCSVLDSTARQNRAVYDEQFRREKIAYYYIVGISCTSFAHANFVTDRQVSSLEVILAQPLFRMLASRNAKVSVSLVDPSSTFVMTRAAEESTTYDALRDDIVGVIEFLRDVHSKHRASAMDKLQGTIGVRLVERIDHSVFLTATELFLGLLPLGQRAVHVPQLKVDSNGNPNDPEIQFIDTIRRSEDERWRKGRRLFEWGPAGMQFRLPYNDVFVSYNRSEHHTMSEIATALHQHGVDVRWDVHLRPGEQATQWIAHEIRRAKVICVCVGEKLGDYQHDVELPMIERAKDRSAKVLLVRLGNGKPALPDWLQGDQPFWMPINPHLDVSTVGGLAERLKQMLDE